MAIVDVKYEVYKCPHCSGYLVIREQYPRDGIGCSISIEHCTELPDWLKQEIREVIGEIKINLELAHDIKKEIK
jgi:hypothetical protein